MNVLCLMTMDLSSNMAATGTLLFETAIIGCSGGGVSSYSPPGHPIIAIKNNRIQTRLCSTEKVYNDNIYCSFLHFGWKGGWREEMVV